MPLGPQRDSITDREREMFEQEKTIAVMQIQHTQKLKEMELEVAKMEVKSAWTYLIKIPLYIIKLPVLLLLGIAYIAATIRGDAMEPEFWSFLTGRDR